MKKILTLITLLLTVATLKAQILHPVTWSYGAKKINAREAVIFIKAMIEPGWHIYSKDMTDGGPVKTSFKFDKSEEYAIAGKMIEPKPVSKMEKSFNMNVSYFEKSVIFQQRIKLKKGATTIKGQLEYMTCNNEKCLPPDHVDFSIIIQ